MYEVETLEHRIRERASRQLREDLEKAAEGLMQFARTGYIVPLKKLVWAADCNGAGNNVSAGHAVQQVIEELHAVWLPSRQDDAIRTFLERVDTIQNELNELRENVAQRE